MTSPRVFNLLFLLVGFAAGALCGVWLSRPYVFDSVLDTLVGSHREVMPANPPRAPHYTRIVFERRGCYGTCPVYRVSFDRGGTARLEAQAHSPFPSPATASIDFSEVALWFSRFHFFHLAPRYPINPDAEMCVLTVEEPGRSHTVAYSPFGETPIDVVALHLFLVRTVDSAHWRRPSPSEAP